MLLADKDHGSACLFTTTEKVVFSALMSTHKRGLFAALLAKAMLKVIDVKGSLLYDERADEYAKEANQLNKLYPGLFKL